ncbi:hypothetical protein DFH08DRAFT_695448 [Mycena albidolilacea]|uniref:BTB domain-containing protein n=1 Tax=Mycena albidolilacea TaxID=1033008 RepID=A0AAD7ETJ5_9AGAR|nr:hypothetical protein DFH08DRAFT_695448 [Mycena albidolilacea]
MTSPAPKRQRIEDAPITRSNIWYDDGSVVLRAEKTEFRVHWGVLAQHSTFFHGLRGLPQPPDQPSVDGCPLVELQDDAVDVEFLLKALYTPTFLSQAALPLVAVGALIRLGRKYDFRDLLDSAIVRLTFENPRTLEEYDTLATSAGAYKPTRILPYQGLTFDIISLVRENGILSALPSAYYRVAQTIPLIIDGMQRADGSVASLAPVDLRRCLLGREKLTHVQMQKGYALGWYRSWCPGNNCTGSHCVTTRDARLQGYLDRPQLKALGLFIPTSIINNRFCDACKQGIELLGIAGRTRTWDELPSFFDLPPWSELKDGL